MFPLRNILVNKNLCSLNVEIPLTSLGLSIEYAVLKKKKSEMDKENYLLSIFNYVSESLINFFPSNIFNM